MLAAILCLSQAVYFEARGESLLGQVAVATIVMNRVDSKFYPSTVCEVVHEGSQFSFYWDGKHERPDDAEAWLLAMNSAVSVVVEGTRVVALENSLWYHGKNIKVSWSERMRRIEIGGHAFLIDDLV